ncbi:MAG: ATP-binding protein [Clostridiales bacterium]|jgi:uncharacterized 2Fe-2S/4Fe-4S cluster protein (DUF4445 family)|nr:ATP-binding protein [Clostridiales bacterium]
MPRLTIRHEGKETSLAFEGSPLLSTVLSGQGLAVAQPCGGRGRCGKCGVDLVGEVSPPNEMEQKAGKRLACQAVLLGDSKVSLPDTRPMAQIQMEGAVHTGSLKPLPGRYGAAVDLGTTTIALRLFDLRSGALLSSAGEGNPQAQVAGDVMGRIGAALDGGLEKLQQLVLSAIESCLEKACQQAGLAAADVETLVIAGNTTMLYLLTGRPPHSLAKAPFHADTLFGEWAEVLGRKAYLPPCMNAFVGADITCAVLASGLTRKEETALLCDVGTNGEIALWQNGTLCVASTAAGPAFEGAGIVMGSASLPGAVDSVWVEDKALKAHVIGDATAASICGSGLIDAVAALLDLELVDETGAMDEPSLIIQGAVRLFRQDIRSVQLAKAAIAAGIDTLLNHAGLSPEQVDAFYLAGGFGSHLDLDSAARIGLMPGALTRKARVIGNASLDGASLLLLNQDTLDQARALAAASRHVALGGNPRFNEAFMEQMLFPETD